MVIPFPSRPESPEPDDEQIIINIAGQRLRLKGRLEVEELPPVPPPVDITTKKTSRSTKLRKT